MSTAVLPDMAAGVMDAEQALLVKLTYWLQTAAESFGASNSTMLVPSMSPNANDARQALLVKAAYWAKQISDTIAGGGGTLQFFTFAAGAPPIDGSITTQGYWDTSTNFKFANTAWPVTAAPTWVAM